MDESERSFPAERTTEKADLRLMLIVCSKSLSDTKCGGLNVIDPGRATIP